MSSRVTPASCPAAGSTLRGMPRSTTSSGRSAREPSGATWSAPTSGPPPRSPSPPRRRRPARRPARPFGRRGPAPRVGRSGPAPRPGRCVRLATTTSAGRRAPQRHQGGQDPRPMSPAPTTTAVVPARPAGRRASASSTAAWENDVVPRAMAVSERTRLPVRTAWRKSSDSTGPAHPLVLRPLPGPADLAEHLALPQHRRLQARGHREQMDGPRRRRSGWWSGPPGRHAAPGLVRQHLLRSRGRRRGSGPPPRRPRSAGRWRGRPTPAGWPGRAGPRAPWPDRPPPRVTRSSRSSGACWCSSPTTTTDNGSGASLRRPALPGLFGLPGYGSRPSVRVGPMPAHGDPACRAQAGGASRRARPAGRDRPISGAGVAVAGGAELQVGVGTARPSEGPSRPPRPRPPRPAGLVEADAPGARSTGPRSAAARRPGRSGPGGRS